MSPVKGQWLCRDELHAERMIPVRIACSEAQMDKIGKFTIKYYDQLAVMYYKLSEDVRILHRKESDGSLQPS